MSKPRSVIVVGGGIVGSCAALAIARAGLGVRHVAPDDPEPASWGNAGHLATEHVEPLASLKLVRTLPRRLFSRGGPVAFVPRDVAAWLPWSLRLLAASAPGRFRAGTAALATLTADAIPAWRRLLGPDADALIREQGHLVVWEGRDAQERGMAALARSATGATTYAPAGARDRAALATQLQLTAFGAARFTGTGQVTDPGLLLRRVRRFADEAGVERIARHARSVQGGARPGVVLDDGTRIAADAVLVAAGVWSAPLLRAAGIPAPLIAERGYHVGFDRPGWPMDLPPLVLDDRAVVVTRFGDRMRATSFVEFGRPQTPPDPRKWDRLEHHLREVGLLDGGCVTRWMGCRPTLPDYLPGIGGDEVAGLYYAVGHAHLGLTLAARTGEIVRDMIAGQAPPPPIFALARFGAIRRSNTAAEHPLPAGDPQQ